MDNLPCEILIKMINFLPLNEILKCKCVCSKWKNSIDNNLRLDKLVISDQLMISRKWYFDSKPVDYYHLIKQFNSILLINQSILKNIKHLYIYLNPQTDSKINQFIKFGSMLSNLKQLQRLEILKFNFAEQNCVLNLPNLTHLSLEDVEFKAITFDTIKLTHLRIISPYKKKMNINFNHPTSIKYLEILYFQSFIMSLINLEYLYCKCFDCILDPKFLKIMCTLKEIHFNQSNRQVNDVFGNLKQQNQKLKRDLKIYIYGMNLTGLPTIKLDDGSIYVSSETTQFICDNYDLLANRVPFFYAIDYSILANSFLEVPIDFRSKFPCIDTIKINSKVKTKEWINFLKNYRTINSLQINCSSLKQKFFNILPYLCPNLRSLMVNELEMFDFDFILKFKNLYSLDTNLELNFDLLYNAFKITNIKQFYFYYNNDYIFMRHDMEENVFKFGLARDEPDEYSSLEEMFGQFQEFIIRESYLNYVNEEAIDLEDEESILNELDESIMSQDLDDELDQQDNSSELDEDVYYLSDLEEIDDSTKEESLINEETDLIEQIDEDSTKEESLINEETESIEEINLSENHSETNSEDQSENDDIVVVFDSDDESSTLKYDEIDISFSDVEEDA